MSQNTFSIAETFIYNIPSHLTHALFTDIRRFSLVSNLYKMRSRKKVKEERTVVFLHIDGDSLPHDHEPGEKVTGKKNPYLGWWDYHVSTPFSCLQTIEIDQKVKIH